LKEPVEYTALRLTFVPNTATYSYYWHLDKKDLAGGAALSFSFAPLFRLGKRQSDIMVLFVEMCSAPASDKKCVIMSNTVAAVVNVIKADATYKGKVLEVTGQVRLVSKERIARITVEIGGRDPQSETIDCDFGSATQAELAGIDLGQTVTIRGKCKGLDRTSNYVVLETCKPVETAAGRPGPRTGRSDRSDEAFQRVRDERIRREQDLQEQADRCYGPDLEGERQEQEGTRPPVPGQEGLLPGMPADTRSE
jgi:hypothetical protein